MTTESREQDHGSARASRKSRGSPAIIEAAGSGALTDAQIKHMVSRFLGWRLPDPFRPDNGITFTPTAHQRGEYGPAHWPVGTNLLDATQAEAMVRHMIEGLPLSAAPERVGGGGWEPIESAPKDGTRVLLGRFTGQRKANYEGYVATDFWHFRGKHGYDGFGNFNSHYWPATHWQPLPSPPIGAEGGRPTSAGDSGCGEGTQEPSPSGARRSDGRGGA